MATTPTAEAAAQSYLDNADFAETGDAGKARAFVTACIRLIVLRAERVVIGQQTVEFRMERLEAEKKDAQAWLRGNAGIRQGGAGIKHVDFAGYRG